MKNSVEKFNALNGQTVSREELAKIRTQAFNEQQFQVFKRISKLEEKYPNASSFELEISTPAKFDATAHGGLASPKKVIEKVKKSIKKVKRKIARKAVKIQSEPHKTTEYYANLGAPQHKGLAKKALTNCGRLKPGYKYIKGGIIVKVAKKELKKISSKSRSENRIYDFIYEVYHNGNYIIKSFLNLPTSRSVKLKEESSNIKNLKYYTTTENGLNSLKKSNPKNAYGEKHTLSSKDLIKNKQTALFGTANTKETVAFNKMILKAKQKGIDSRKVFKLGITKSVLKSCIGSHVILISGATIKKSMVKDNDHNVEWHHIINLPDNINKPFAIFKSKTKGYVVLTEILDYKNKPLMVAIHLSKNVKITEIKSIYSRRNNAIYKKWKEVGLLIYLNKKSDLVKQIFGTIPKEITKSQGKNTKTNPHKKNHRGLSASDKPIEKIQTPEDYNKEIKELIDNNNFIEFNIPVKSRENEIITVNQPIDEELEKPFISANNIEVIERQELSPNTEDFVITDLLEASDNWEEKSPSKKATNILDTIDKINNTRAKTEAPGLPDELSKLGVKKMSDTDSHTAQYYAIRGDLAKFIGDIEIKPVESVAITLDAPQGGGKTRLMFQLIDMFADAGYKGLFASLEEHPESTLFINKKNEYIKPKNKQLIDSIGGLKGFDDLKKLVPYYDIIYIDSWGKLAELEKQLDFDRDLRKAFNGKLFVVIFQRTQSGQMRGGSKSQFDGDIIMKIKKEDDYKNSFAYFDKHRYHKQPLNNLKYFIYSKQVRMVDEKDILKDEEKYITL